MSDGSTVYVLKLLEYEQSPLLLSHQASYSSCPRCFYYQRNVRLPLLIPAHSTLAWRGSLPSVAAATAPQPPVTSGSATQHRKLLQGAARSLTVAQLGVW